MLSGTCTDGFHNSCGGRLPTGWCTCPCHDGKRWYVKTTNRVYDDEAVAWEFCSANESPQSWSPKLPEPMNLNDTTIFLIDHSYLQALRESAKRLAFAATDPEWSKAYLSIANAANVLAMMHTTCGTEPTPATAKSESVASVPPIPGPVGVNFGKVAYDAYCTYRSWKAYNGDPLPQWDAVKPDIQNGWLLAASAVIAAQTAEPEKPMSTDLQAVLALVDH